ncbi:MAG: carboxylesterase [Gammaproteobacteria bacterium]|nr:carboxylesterase [Gammaproteobacteria bacterium]MCW8924426.1 carboxylesterase [Gammaproteobacteria bacterium]
MPELDAIEIETGASPDAAVIWLHGLGANGNDFAPIIPQLHLPPELSVRFIFPHAPVRPISINQGYQMPGWYDIASLNIVDDEDEAGISQSSEAIRAICHHQQVLGIASNRIILAGFSQGGAIALHCGLSHPDPLAGIMALSTYLPRCTPLHGRANQNIDIFMAHGQQDDVVAPDYGRLSREHLEKSGYSVNWHEYAMQHSVCLEEIHDISEWLIKVLEA